MSEEKMYGGKLLFDGNEKQVYSTDNPEQVVFHFKDVATAYNNVKKAVLVDKGKVNNEISALLFTYLERNGIHTHFISKIEDRAQLCRKSRNIPLELKVRNYFSGSIVDRLGVKDGVKASVPIFELSYNRQDLGDPMINDSEAIALGIVNQEELSEIYGVADKVNKLLSELCSKAGLNLVDFKLEFGWDAEGRLMICDEISPDTARFRDSKTGESLDKDRFRLDLAYIVASYEKLLNRLRSVIDEESSKTE